ncbi:MAG: hypothetical protein WCB85_13115 [Candidatus Dormiibacterota bacterium]
MVRLVVASDQPAAMLADPPSAVSRRFGPRELVGFERDEVQERSAWSPRTWLPPQKIAWGVLLTLLVVTAPLGLPLLVIGLVQLRRPVWRVRVLVAEAEREPPDARALLESAYAVAPDSPLVLAAMARWHHRHLHLAAAIRFYRAYLAQAPDDWRMRAWYAAACLRHGAVDASIASFTVVVAGAGLSAEARASASAHLAYGLMCSEDLREARAVLGRVTPPSGEALSPAQRQCVYYSAVVDYLLGERDQAIATVDRLAALDPDYPELPWTALAMRARSFHLLLPDGEALVPAAGSTGVERVPATPLRCASCGAPREEGAVRCPICQAGLIG